MHGKYYKQIDLAFTSWCMETTINRLIENLQVGAWKKKCKQIVTYKGFIYLGTVVSDNDSKPEVLSRIAQGIAFLTKLKPVRRDNKKDPIRI